MCLDISIADGKMGEDTFGGWFCLAEDGQDQQLSGDAYLFAQDSVQDYEFSGTECLIAKWLKTCKRNLTLI